MSLTKRWTDEREEQTGMPVIFAYTDEMAFDDGALVDIESLGLVFEGKPINRIAAALSRQEQGQYSLADVEEAADADAINFDLEAFGKTIAVQLPTSGG